MPDIIIDKEFKDLIPPLTEDEYKGLEQSILADGCRDAIVLWNNIIVDGHNRYEICQKHGLKFQTVEKKFDDRDSVKLWMMHNQLARRNLSDLNKADIISKCEPAVRALAEKRQISTRFGNTGGGNISTTVGKSRDELGALGGMSGKTYEHGVTVLREAPKAVVDAARKNDITINEAYKVTKAAPEVQEEIARRLEHIDEEPAGTNTASKIIKEVLKPHVTHNSGNNEWYTPESYITLVRNVLGEIELDPASCTYANETVQAKTYYSLEDDGLKHDWTGKVYMNPPYASGLIEKFTQKFAEEYSAGKIEEGIVLVNNATETGWFNELAKQAKAIVFPKSRIKFISPDKNTSTPLQGQAFLYFGHMPNIFLEEFADIGICCKVVR